MPGSSDRWEGDLVPFVLGAIVIALLLLLFGLLSSLDMGSLRREPEGLLSLGGVWLVVGGGFLAGVAYGVLIGRRGGADVAVWLGRGVIDGLVVACAGAFYLGFVQRRRKGPPGPPDDGDEL
jgi:hypothetical protein